VQLNQCESQPSNLITCNSPKLKRLRRN